MKEFIITNTVFIITNTVFIITNTVFTVIVTVFIITNTVFTVIVTVFIMTYRDHEGVDASGTPAAEEHGPHQTPV